MVWSFGYCRLINGPETPGCARVAPACVGCLPAAGVRGWPPPARVWESVRNRIRAGHCGEGFFPAGRGAEMGLAQKRGRQGRLGRPVLG